MLVAANGTLIYIIPKTREIFDRIHAPVIDFRAKAAGLKADLLVKQVEADEVTIIFQYWLEADSNE